MTGHTEFYWYASADAEIYKIREDSREAVISAAKADRLGQSFDDDGNPCLRFYICEASKYDLRIADYAIPSDKDELFENIEEDASQWDFGNPDGGSGDIFACSDKARADLLDRLKATCEQWQVDHKLSWESWAFAISRNEETIVVPLASEGGDA
ncbi:MAG: hypothetical protein ACK4SQ_16165 [Allorhizobium sp.]